MKFSELMLSWNDNSHYFSRIDSQHTGLGRDMIYELDDLLRQWVCIRLRASRRRPLA